MIHRTSCIDDGAIIGVGTTVWHFCHVRENAVIGRDCVLGQGVYVDAGVVIGDRVKIQNNVSVYRGVTVEDDVFLGPSCVFTNVSRPRSPYPQNPSEYASTRVCRGASVGANATVRCGVRIGEWAFVGAGAVVTRDVAPHALVIGLPARRVSWVCRCGRSLSVADGLDHLPCECGARIALDEGIPVVE